jgi:predicted CXXCH cytochrome family protein
MMDIRRLYMTFIVVFFLAVAPVWADNGPHGDYTATTDACAGCHRAHTAQGDNLLITGPSYDLCLTCHGASGNGADTDVADGVYLQRDDEVETPDEGVVNRGLKAGGFINARMDVGWSGSAAPAPVTSSHLWDESNGVAWGSGATGSGPGSGMSLTCVSCHNPHGGEGGNNSATYRILRIIPIGSGDEQTIVFDEDPKHYTVDDASGKYFGQDYDDQIYSDIAHWCARCHDRYLALSGSGHTDSGDPIFAYRHISVGTGCGCHDMHGGPPPTGNPNYRHDPLSCLTCHVAHGTSAIMTGHASDVPWPDGSTSPGGNARSALLRVNNRGVCQLCHDK